MLSFYKISLKKYKHKNKPRERIKKKKTQLTKNKVKNFSKDTLNQLRIYLSKKSVGRFGILTVRDGKENHAISTAREYAYAHSDILILILDDQDIVELLISKTVFGSADKFLHRKIIEFELKQ